MAFERGGLDLLRELNALPRWPAAASESNRLVLMHEENALREQLVSYVYAFDAGDLDAVMSFFADECVLTNPRGRFVGVDAIRANYHDLFRRWPVMRHLWTNVAVRFPHRAEEAYLTAYHYGILTAGSETVAAVGNDAQRLSKVSDRWLIDERWISVDVRQDIMLQPVS